MAATESWQVQTYRIKLDLREELTSTIVHRSSQTGPAIPVVGFLANTLPEKPSGPPTSHTEEKEIYFTSKSVFIQKSNVGSHGKPAQVVENEAPCLVHAQRSYTTQ